MLVGCVFHNTIHTKDLGDYNENDNLNWDFILIVL